MTPMPDGPSRVDVDLQSHAKTLSVLTMELSEVKQDLAVMTEANKHRDEKLTSILGLGRTVLVTVLTLALGAGFAFVAGGGLRVSGI